MLGEIRTPSISFPDYANFPSAEKPDKLPWITVDDEPPPPPLPPRRPRNTSPPTLSPRAPLVSRTQSLKTGSEAPRRDLAPVDPNHRRRSLRLTCGGGLVATVDVSASCPPTPLSGANCFPDTTSIHVRVDFAETNPRYRYPFQALILGESTGAEPLAKKHGGSSPQDFECITATQHKLRESGFYYEGVSWQEAIDLLANKPEGTFLVRDSQDPKFLFSLSVQTKRGPTSVRIHYEGGLFYFDAVRKMADVVPRKPCVVDLVDFYVAVCDSDRLKCHVWLDKNGDTFDHVRLRAPLKHSLAPLKHCARVEINRTAGQGSALREDVLRRLPAKLRQYLEEYPNTS